MRTRKLVTEVGLLHAPEDFMFVPLVVQDYHRKSPPLQAHLVSIFDSQAILCVIF